jgi:hypothetical protein
MLEQAGSLMKAEHSLFLKVRVRKEDSAFIYFILESYEGITSYSTLDSKQGDAHRDLELRIPPDFVEEVRSLLQDLNKENHQKSDQKSHQKSEMTGMMIYELKE